MASLARAEECTGSVTETMTKNRHREKLVRSLNAAAKHCEVGEVPVTSKKAKVLILIAAIRASSGPLSAKTAANIAFADYEATFALAPENVCCVSQCLIVFMCTVYHNASSQEKIQKRQLKTHTPVMKVP